MPELPEVETTRRGLAPHLVGAGIIGWTVREPRLRWPVADELAALRGRKIRGLSRRAKYLMLECEGGSALIHLGMSGSLRLCEPADELRKHDHILMDLSTGRQLRYHDPRRFGVWLWAGERPLEHPLLRGLGPEPLERAFDAEYLHERCRRKKAAIKQTIMDARVVAGVGNIYACEALFLAGIDPRRASGAVSRFRLGCLVEAIRKVLRASLRQGGTTLRDYLRGNGEPGYFRQRLGVYGREGEPCRSCGCPVRRVTLSQRSTFFCPACQR